MRNAATIRRRVYETASFSLFVALALAAAPWYLGGNAWAQSNPVPLINQPLVPDATAPGGQSFTLTVNGTGFVSGAVVQWNGTALPTTFASGLQLTAAVPASNIATPGTALVAVMNPVTGTVSNAVFFSITRPVPAVGFGRSEFSTGLFPYSLATADFNSDGRLDLVATNQGQNDLSVLLGNGDGTFQTAVNYGVNGYPIDVITADLNGDGKMDLVTTVLGTTAEVAVLSGNGDGTFQNPVYSTVSSSTSGDGLVAADFNRDGKLDVGVALDDGQVAVLLGNGDGTFQSVVDYFADTGFSDWLASGDFNGDGYLDLAVSAGNDNAVAILLGNGDGTFRNAVEYATGGESREVLTADFNGDGKLDLALAMAIQGGDAALSVLLGNGDGSFQPYQRYLTDPFAFALQTTDLNGDGKLDLIAASETRNAVLTLFGNGDGTFQKPGEFSTGGNSNPNGMVAGDFNGDGMMDLAVASSNANAVSVLPEVTSVLSGTLVNFGAVKSGSSKTVPITLSNTGAASFQVLSITLGGRSALDFTEKDNCRGRTLQPGGSCALAITFKPPASTTYRAGISIKDTAVGVPETIFLEGVGIQ